MSRKLAKSLILWIAHRFGPKLVDPVTGQAIGRVLIIPYKGQLTIVGLQRTVRPEFVPQPRLTYLYQKLAFRLIPRPDYDNVRSQHDHSHAPKT